jgi:hypothetical protein
MTTSVLWSRKKELVTEFGLTKNRYVCPVFCGETTAAGTAGARTAKENGLSPPRYLKKRSKQ